MSFHPSFLPSFIPPFFPLFLSFSLLYVFTYFPRCSQWPGLDQGRSLDSGIQSGPPTQVAGTQLLEPAPLPPRMPHQQEAGSKAEAWLELRLWQYEPSMSRRHLSCWATYPLLVLILPVFLGDQLQLSPIQPCPSPWGFVFRHPPTAVVSITGTDSLWPGLQAALNPEHRVSWVSPLWTLLSPRGMRIEWPGWALEESSCLLFIAFGQVTPLSLASGLALGYPQP